MSSKRSKFGFLQPVTTPVVTTKARKAGTKGPAAPIAVAPTIGRPKTGKSSDPNFTAMTVYVPIELHRAVRGLLITEGGGELSDLVAVLLAEWLKVQKAKRPKG